MIKKDKGCLMTAFVAILCFDLLQKFQKHCYLYLKKYLCQEISGIANLGMLLFFRFQVFFEQFHQNFL